MTDSPWFTKDEAASYLRVSPDTMDRYVSTGLIRKRMIRNTRTVRFHKDDLDAALHDPAETLSVEREVTR